MELIAPTTKMGWGKIKQICSLIGGVILCIYMIPFFTALLLGLSLLIIPTKNFIFFSSMLEAAAFGVSGFLMALIISYFSVNREISTTLFGSLLVATFYAVPKVIIIFYFPQPCYWWLLEIILEVVFLLGFATLGAWLIARRRYLRLQKWPKTI